VSVALDHLGVVVPRSRPGHAEGDEPGRGLGGGLPRLPKEEELAGLLVVGVVEGAGGGAGGALVLDPGGAAGPADVAELVVEGGVVADGGTVGSVAVLGALRGGVDGLRSVPRGSGLRGAVEREFWEVEVVVKR